MWAKSLMSFYLSNEKRPKWLFRVWVGDEVLPRYVGVYIYNHEIMIPIKQPVQWKVRGFFLWLTWKDHPRTIVSC